MLILKAFETTFHSLKSTILAKFSFSNCLQWVSVGVGGCSCLVGEAGFVWCG